MYDISQAMMDDLLNARAGSIIHLEDKTMGSGMTNKNQQANGMLGGLSDSDRQMQGLSNMFGPDARVHGRQLQQDQYRQYDRNRDMEEHFRREFELKRDREMAMKLALNPRYEGVDIKREVENINHRHARDIDKCDIRTYLQAKTDDWLKGVKL